MLEKNSNALSEQKKKILVIHFFKTTNSYIYLNDERIRRLIWISLYVIRCETSESSMKDRSSYDIMGEGNCGKKKRIAALPIINDFRPAESKNRTSWRLRAGEGHRDNTVENSSQRRVQSRHGRPSFFFLDNASCGTWFTNVT